MFSKKISQLAWMLLFIFAGIFSACRKDYYEDSGLQIGIYPESGLAFLQQKPFYFDSLVTVVHLAGMDAVLEDSTVTFFAPTDHSIAKAMDIINAERYNKFEDSLRLEDIPSEVWKKFLSRYIFQGKYMLKDIARRDDNQLNVYPGMNLESWEGYIMNIGTVFSDYEGTKDVGPRQIEITDIGDLANPVNYTSLVATSDIQTSNCIIHILDDDHDFSFSLPDFETMVNQYIH